MTESPPPHPIPKDQFMKLVPSSKAAPKAPPASWRHYTITVQRRERSGRWNQVATWTVHTDEEDMDGPLQMGLKPNYRIVVREGHPPPPPEPDSAA